MEYKKIELESIILDCKDCKRKIVHIYLGNFGVPWKPQYTYQCRHCKTLYVSKIKLKNKNENKSK